MAEKGVNGGDANSQTPRGSDILMLEQWLASSYLQK